jgi:hypothetical protein
MSLGRNLAHGLTALIYVKVHKISPNNKGGLSAGKQAELDKCMDGVRSVGRNLDKLAEASKAAHCGNCEEMTAIVMGRLGQAKVSPREQMVLWISSPNAHVFVLIGRKQGSTETDPSTWGPDAVIIDPWHGGGKVYAASEIETQMYRGAQNYQGKLEPVSVGRIN